MIKRYKVVVLDEKSLNYKKTIYQYGEYDVIRLLNVLKGVMAERDDPLNKDRFLAPQVHYMTEDSEMSVWEAARREIKLWEEI